MNARDPLRSLLTALSAAVLGRREPGAAARVGMPFLREALAGRGSVVVEVRFTGFTTRGGAVGREAPGLLRAAGRLIVLGVARVGLTAEAGEEDLRALFEVLSRSPRQLEASGGPAVALAEAAPYGVYLATTAGEVYKPAPRPAAAPTDPSAEGLDAFAPIADDGTAAPPGDEPSAVPPAGPEPGPADDEEIEGPIRALAGAESPDAFAAVAAQIAAAAGGRLEEGDLTAAVPLLQALLEEAERPERPEPLRAAALDALHGAVGGRAVAGMAGAVEGGAPGAREVLALLPGLGEEAAGALEALLFRCAEAELARSLFLALAASADGRERLLRAVQADPRGDAARRLFVLARLPGLEEEFVLRLAEAAAGHPDPEMRQAGARAAGAVGGREAVGILTALLDDRKRSVKLRALAELERVGHPAAVPALAELLEEGAEEEIEIAAVEALGATRKPDAIPPLLAVLGRRQLFGGKRLQKRKLAAVRALGRVRDRRSREVLVHLASSRDSALAAEAAAALKEQRPIP